ncbi:MAG: cyclic nucleotide-binding domain-containing protein [Desulfobacterales bacterium]|nr:cyclic nucleotide-binding domain-containing protein [Desulfobacterales bacterium]
MIAEQGKTPIDHVYVVKSGQLSLYDQKSEGLTLGGYIKRNEVFGGITLLMNGGISLRTVRVDEATEAYLIPPPLFLDLCKRFKTFYDYFVENFSKHIFDPSLAAIISSGQAKTFLADVAPFSFLPEDALERVATNLSMVSHPKGAMLFRQGATRLGYLYILQRGVAERYYEREGHKTMLDILSEGDLYGGISMLVNDGLAVRSLEVIEDSVFYILPKKIFLQLCEVYTEFSEFFTDTFGKRMLDKSYAAIIARSATPPEEGVQFFHQSVGQMYNPAPVFGTADMTIQQAALTMRQEKSTYVIIPASKSHSAGILTDSDLAYKVIASGYDIRRRAVEIMSSPLRTISDQAMIFEALMNMMQYNIKHLAVIDAKERMIGMFSHREVLSAQGQSPIFLLHNVAKAESLEEIVQQHQRLPRLVKALISNGAEARHINRFISTLSDAILKKVIEFVLQELGPPPIGFAFMIMGSEGRGEQTLKTDQDNAIVFEDVNAEETARARPYFLELGQKACAMLAQAGFALCRGDVMAQNPRWCQPLSVWKDYFLQWIHAAQPEDLLQASIFFDFRGVYGEVRLVDDLRNHLYAAIGRWSGFLRYMTENALNFRPPLGFFRNFVVESKGEHRDALDIKSAMMPIVDFARIYALKNGIEVANTLERLQQLCSKEAISRQEHEELEKAYSFLMQLRFMRQVSAVLDQKIPADNFINPKRLTRIEQTMLKEIFKRIEKFQAKMNFDFVGIA